MTALASQLTPPVLAHLAATLSLQGDGSFAYWNQDTIDDVGQCVEMVVGTPAGMRTVVPGFGIPDITFTQPNQQEIVNAIRIWEPRAIPTVQVSYPNGGEAQVTVQVGLNQGTIT